MQSSNSITIGQTQSSKSGGDGAQHTNTQALREGPVAWCSLVQHAIVCPSAVAAAHIDDRHWPVDGWIDGQ